MSLQSLLEYMGIETDMILIEPNDDDTTPDEGPENDCS